MAATECDASNQVTVERGEATGRKAADAVKDEDIAAALAYAVGFAARLEERRHPDAHGVLAKVSTVEWKEGEDGDETALTVDGTIEPVGAGDRILYVRGG